jgi:3-hydroxyacyl-[acyl-carrier-protein] dehydratase
MHLEYFKLIDRIVDLNLGEQTIRAEAVVPETNTIFEGHFPGRPLMPGVLLIEAMAQTSGWLVVGLTRFERMPFLAAVKDAKLRTFVEPGQMLSISAKLVHDGSGYSMTSASITRENKAVCSAEITFRVMEFPNATFRESMRRVATEVGFPMKALSHG